MFYLSLALGALFLVMVHHLTDAGWSVGIRRFCEHIASLLFPWLAILFLPVLFVRAKNLSLADVDRPPTISSPPSAGVHLRRVSWSSPRFCSACGGC